MSTILMSIKPEYAESILKGDKKYEYRKNICKEKVEKIIIYSTKPVMKVVGEAEVESIIVDNPTKIWRKTKNGAGVDKNFFDCYYKEKKMGVAYKLKNVIKYKKPRLLSEYGVSNAPQSYVYLR